MTAAYSSYALQRIGWDEYCEGGDVNEGEVGRESEWGALKLPEPLFPSFSHRNCPKMAEIGKATNVI